MIFLFNFLGQNLHFVYILILFIRFLGTESVFCIQLDFVYSVSWDGIYILYVAAPDLKWSMSWVVHILEEPLSNVCVQSILNVK